MKKLTPEIKIGFIVRGITLFLLISLLPMWAVSQTNSISHLYNDKGQFRPDTSLSITMDQWKIWKEAELDIYDVCGHGYLASNLKREIKKK